MKALAAMEGHWLSSPFRRFNMNSLQRRQLLRAALAIRRRLDRHSPQPALRELPSAGVMLRAQRLLRLARLAEARSWTIAAPVCRDRLRRALEELKAEFQASLDELKRTPERHSVSLLGDIYDDLVALQDEFQDMQLDLKGRRVSVKTQPIELEGQYLGRYEIALDYERLDEGASCYEILALDGSGSAADDEVTHPHVRSGTLCEGEAYGPIRAALSSGRILDFFTVVNRTLHTYNPESAFVSLDRWDGTPCTDCGTTVGDEDGSSCDRCDDVLCYDCGGCCTGCDSNVCSGCQSDCPGCDEPFCRRCLSPCSSCNKRYCKRCLDEEFCPDCREGFGEEEAFGEAEAVPPAAAAQPPLQPVCVGEAGLSA
jgi:hypothetical protein